MSAAPTDPVDCAILYVPEAYQGDKAKVVGRQSAGAGFLDAFLRYGARQDVHCVTTKAPFFEEFRARVARVSADRRCHLVQPGDHAALARVGLLYQPGPLFGDSAWLRRRGDESSYSLCGVTHSVATERATRGIRDYVIAPTQPWDAVVCTSVAVRKAVQRIFGSWRDYLETRGFVVPEPPLALPIIPLGVDLARYAPTEERRARGKALRKSLGIEDGDVVVLWFGRITVQSKAHITPMLQAVELAQRGSIDRRIHFVLCGQFGDPVTQRELDPVRMKLARSVRVHWIDGVDTARCDDAWHAADVFLCLSDNAQESFGLTAIEAQAAGLPVVAGDWDGYRDTIVHGETGFLAPTTIPAPGDGVELADDHAAGLFDQESLLALTAQCTAIDVDRVADALTRLAVNAELRARMGAQARRRAELLYDWRVVFADYQALWAEQRDRREHARAQGPRTARDRGAHPDFPDPFRVFEAHATRCIGDDDRVVLVDVEPDVTLSLLRTNAIHMFSHRYLLPAAALDGWVARLMADGASTVGALVEASASDRARAHRTIAWLAKFGVVRVEAS